MIAEAKQLEGLGRLLKAAGVKPAVAEQLIQTHLDELHSDAKLQHTEISEMASALKEELIELRHSQSQSVSEVRIATDLMRREIEAISITVLPILRAAKRTIILFAILQIVIFGVVMSTMGRNSLRWPNIDLTMFAAEPAAGTAQKPLAPPK